MTWQALADEHWLLYSHAGFLLLDDFTGLPPKYPVRAHLDYQDGADWIARDIAATITPSGIVSYPALGRSIEAVIQPMLRHRVRLQSDFYRPEYLLNIDGIEFDVHHYDDNNPPLAVPTHPQTLLLLPTTAYAYGTHVRVVKGLVRDAGGDPVANVEISEGINERTISDARGAFSLPLRWPAPSASVTLDAVDHRTGRSDSLLINLPGGLSHGHLFTIV